MLKQKGSLSLVACRLGYQIILLLLLSLAILPLFPVAEHHCTLAGTHFPSHGG